MRKQKVSSADNGFIHALNGSVKFSITLSAKLFKIQTVLRSVKAVVICALGVNALVIVALKDKVDHQALEFGRGFNYHKPLSINMLNVGNALLEQLVSFYYLKYSNKSNILRVHS